MAILQWCGVNSLNLIKLNLKVSGSNVLTGIATIYTNIECIVQRIWKVMSHNVLSQCHAVFDILLYYVGAWHDTSSTHLYKSYGFVSISCPFWWKRNHNHSSKPSCKKTLFEVCLNLSFNYNTMCPSTGNSSQQKIWATNSARKLTCLKKWFSFWNI